jgi:hypothetical protein
MKMKEIYEPVAVMVAKMVAKATAKRQSKPVQRAFFMCNGYVVERLSPSGKFKIQHEALQRCVIVDSLKAAKKVALNNSKSE